MKNSDFIRYTAITTEHIGVEVSEQNQTAGARDFGNFVQLFQVEDLDVRGRIVRIEDAFARAVEAHAYPPVVARLVGEMIVLAAILGTALKFDGIFTLQAQGDGPVSLLMADVTSDGDIRACAKVREGATIDNDASLSIPQLMGTGHMALTVDQGADMDRYQGITELNGASLAECAQNYFRQSEQLETAIAIVSELGDAGGAPRAAGLMVQRLPTSGDGEKEDEAWRRAVVLMSSIRADELLNHTLGPAELLYRLYHEDGVRLFDQRNLRHQCRCSEERVSRTLLSFPKSEVLSLMEDGEISVTCEFCGTHYVYGEPQLEAMFRVEGKEGL